jgi:hypothetical protein
MRRQHPGPADSPAELTNHLYDLLLKETREVARQSLNRLRALRDRYPSAFPREHLLYLQELCSPSPTGGVLDRKADRRVSPRFPIMGTRLTIASAEDGTVVHNGFLMDQSWQGLLILSPRPEGVDSVLEVHSADASEDFADCWVEVRHCRTCEGGWAVGCRFLDL